MRTIPLLLVLLMGGSAAAQERCAVPEGVSPVVGTWEAGLRLRYLTESLEHAGPAASTWNWGWGLGYTGVAGLQLGAAPFLDDRGRRIDFTVGGTRSGIAALSLVFLHLPTARERDAVRATRLQGCEAVAFAEGALSRAARGEARGKSWTKHAAAFALNAAAALVLGLGYDRWDSAAISFGSGMLVGEIMIFTQPTRARDAWRRYQAGEAVASPADEMAWLLVPSVRDAGAGLVLLTRF